MPVLFAHQSLASGSLNGVPARTFLIGQVLAPSPAEESCLSTTAFPMKVKVIQSSWTLCDPMDYTCDPMEFTRPEYWSRQPFPSSGDLPNPGIKPTSPALQADSLAAEPQGKPKNTGVDSQSLLQRIFPTQESNGFSALPVDSLPTELSGKR